jgi:hypothetical protein
MPVTEQLGQVVEADRHVGMIRAEALFIIKWRLD